MQEVGIRELRNNVASVVRRAQAGERIIVTIDGHPVAQIGAIDARQPSISLADLIASGTLRSPQRSTSGSARAASINAPDQPADTNVQQLLRQVRGA